MLDGDELRNDWKTICRLDAVSQTSLQMAGQRCKFVATLQTLNIHILQTLAPKSLIAVCQSLTSSFLAFKNKSTAVKCSEHITCAWEGRQYTFGLTISVDSYLLTSDNA